MAVGDHDIICIKPFRKPNGGYAQYGERVGLHDLAAQAKVSSGRAVWPKDFKRRPPRPGEQPVDEAAAERETKPEGPEEGQEVEPEELDDEEVIQSALASDNGNDMRSALARVSEESVAGMKKPEIREALEAKLEELSGE